MDRNCVRSTRLTILVSTLDVRLTANARALASRQLGAFQSHSHAQNSETLDRTGNANAAGGTLLAVRNVGNGLVTLASGGPETRPVNTAYHPRIHA